MPNIKGLSDTEMFTIILQKIDDIHKRINDLVTAHSDARIEDAQKFGKIHAKLAVNKVKIGAMIGGISVVVAAVVTWVVNFFLEK